MFILPNSACKDPAVSMQCNIMGVECRVYTKGLNIHYSVPNELQLQLHAERCTRPALIRFTQHSTPAQCN